MADTPGGYLATLLGPHTVTQDGGAAVLARPQWDFVNITITDDPVNNKTLFTGSTGGGSTLPITRTIRVTAFASNITTADDLVEVTNAGAAQTLPGTPSNGHQYEVCNNTAGNNNVLGNGHNFSATGTATFTLGPGQSLTATYSSGSSMWLCS